MKHFTFIPPPNPCSTVGILSSSYELCGFESRSCSSSSSTRHSRVHSRSLVDHSKARSSRSWHEKLSHFSQGFLKAARQQTKRKKSRQESNSPQWPLTSVSTMFGWLFTSELRLSNNAWFNKEVDCCRPLKNRSRAVEVFAVLFPHIFHPFCLLSTIFKRIFTLTQVRAAQRIHYEYHPTMND